MKKLKVVVDREKWCRGQKNGNPALVTGSRTMCCLGFVGVACGFTKKEMLLLTSPGQISYSAKNKTWPKGMLNKYDFASTLTNNLVDINDSIMMNDSVRERKLKKTAKEIGIEFQFVN